MQQQYFDALRENPIIAAVRSDDDLREALRRDVAMVFVLYGDVCSVTDIARKLHEAKKLALVHLDLVTGLAPREASVEYIRRMTEFDGILTTRPNLVQKAKELGLLAVLRVFLIDSASLATAISARSCHPDAIDILPGLMPSMIRKVARETGLPVLTGGLITDKQEILQALDAGALAISTTDRRVWDM